MKTVIHKLVFGLFLFFSYILNGQVSIGGFNVYYGHLHNHCNISDGTGSVGQAYIYAKNTGNLDFFSVADHEYSMTAAEYTQMKKTADSINADGVFTAFYGFEWSHSTYGHVAVIGSSDYCTSAASATNTFSELVTWLSSRDVVAFFNHPGRQNGSPFVEFDHFNSTPSDKLVGMELWNKLDRFEDYYYNDGFATGDGTMGYYDEALTRNWKIGAGGSEDNHWGSWGTYTSSKMAILANAKTRTDIMNAMKARRFYTTYDKNLGLSFKINGSEMGSTITGGTFTMQIQATDGTSDVFSQVQLLKDGAVVNTWTPNTTAVNISQSLSCSDGEYYYVRVKQTDADEAVSSPIWIEGGSAIVPTFDQIGPLCQFSVAPALPVFSNNSVPIKGSWNPPLISTYTVGSIEYTFTPYPGQSVVNATMTITVNAAPTPLFSPTGPFHRGETIDPLPLTSLNGISGSWSPVLNNTLTTTYLFTPSIGQCSTNSWKTITIYD
jgi:hypothetical protein